MQCKSRTLKMRMFPLFLWSLCNKQAMSAATSVCDNTCQSLWCHSLKDQGEFCWQSAKKANRQRKLSACSSIFPSTVPYLFWCLLVVLKLITDEYLPGYFLFFLMGLVLYKHLMATAVFLQSGLLWTLQIQVLTHSNSPEHREPGCFCLIEVFLPCAGSSFRK